ncbi:unnamed protein product [Effrenium voratum]|uniref:Uncharacterized protein n=1 Tax=Effrenium voratum TaxID=2562239 RepID=A0AA36MU83_9DINO|nr:unnamed protein product [Effrenium voratum]CAJ1418998.1 unnamed protein product [Effrenium voratum]
MRMTQLSELVGEPCACGLPLMWMWQIGSPVARGSVACADAALSGARFASVAGPGLARSQNRALPFRSMAHQIRAQRLSQISSHASWTVWAGSSVARRRSKSVQEPRQIRNNSRHGSLFPA